MTVSLPGLIGAGLGLLIALVTYVLMSGALKQQASANPATVVDDAKSPASMIRTILLADFVVLAAVGYYVGQLLG